MEYTEIFSAVKIENFRKILIFFFFLLNSGVSKFGDAVLTCTHNLCFGAKIRKIGIPLHTPVLLYKSTRTCFPDVEKEQSCPIHVMNIRKTCPCNVYPHESHFYI